MRLHAYRSSLLSSLSSPHPVRVLDSSSQWNHISVVMLSKYDVVVVVVSLSSSYSVFIFLI